MAEDLGSVQRYLSSQDPDNCGTCAIRHSSLCGALSSEEIASMNDIAVRKRFEPGQSFLFQGDAQHSFANVTHGVAKLVRGASDGRSQIVGLLFASDFLGSALNTSQGEAATYSIEAISDMELCVFPKSKFETVMHEFPALELKLLNRTLTELNVAREWMVLLGRKTAEERVATFLLHVAEKMKNVSCRGQTSFELPLNRADIADYLGLTLETVSRRITQLRKENIIEVDGRKHVTFIDEGKLRQRANL